MSQVPGKAVSGCCALSFNSTRRGGFLLAAVCVTRLHGGGMQRWLPGRCISASRQGEELPADTLRETILERSILPHILRRHHAFRRQQMQYDGFP